MPVQTVQQFRDLVGSELVDAVDGHTRDVANPATGAVIARVPEGSEEDVDRAVRAASEALTGWRESTPGDRAARLLAMADLLNEHTEELARLESANVGKPLSLAREEIPISSDNLRFFAGAARCLEGRAAGEYVGGYTSMIRQEPVGVVGQIAPWNYPLQMAIWKIGPALAVGNAVVLKPSELRPISLLRFAELISERGLLPAVQSLDVGDPVRRGDGRHGSGDLRGAPRARPGVHRSGHRGGCASAHGGRGDERPRIVRRAHNPRQRRAGLGDGGFKQSGYGKDMSIYAVQEYTEIKHVMINLQ